MTIDGKKAGEHHFTNDSDSTEIKWTDAGTIELPCQITNTQGAELPSTGGIGTTIFYLIGAVLVIGAGVLLVTRRRMKAE